MTQGTAPLPRNAGHFIVIEGIDGSGSTTQGKRLTAALGAAGLTTEFTHEPSPGPIGVLIRQVLAKRLVVADVDGSRAPDWRTMALLFAADRVDHIDAVVAPRIRDGVTVVSDRYTLSSLAYQSATSPGGLANLPWIRALNQEARVPDLTLVLRVSPEVAAGRRSQRGGPAELYEIEALQRRLAELYARADELLGYPVTYIDADGDADLVSAAIWRAVSEHLRLAPGPAAP